jgi:hypothetical protein
MRVTGAGDQNEAGRAIAARAAVGRRPRSALAGLRAPLLALAVTAVYPTLGGAFQTGETLHSGKQGVTCSVCHSGGVAPTVSFSGPSELAVGASGTYTFEVDSMAAKQRAAGFNVAASDGTLGAVAGQGEQLIGAELTHTMPKANVDMVADWSFTWTAPAAPGTYTLFGAGNSVNLNGLPTGDRSSATTFMVMVAGADSPTPTPTATPFPPAETPTPPAADTPTPPGSGSPVPCVGDCAGNRMVAVNELITGVNIALGNLSIASCPGFDGNGDETVSISDLIAAVNNALNGCP